MGRYTGSPDTLVLDQRVEVRGFSAGSFCRTLPTAATVEKIPNVVTSGKLGAIACPPQFADRPTCNSCSPSFSLRGGPAVCVEA